MVIHTIQYNLLFRGLYSSDIPTKSALLWLVNPSYGHLIIFTYLSVNHLGNIFLFLLQYAKASSINLMVKGQST